MHERHNCPITLGSLGLTKQEMIFYMGQEFEHPRTLFFALGTAIDFRA